MTKAGIERYHKWVSQLPCAVCGVHGMTQVAHLHGVRKPNFGGGMGRKSHWLMVMPLCHSNCHPNYDSGGWQIGNDPKYAESEAALFLIAQTLCRAVDEEVLKA